MASTATNPNAVVVDANVAIAICAKEADKFVSADAKIRDYATNGARFFAPGVIVAECLFVFCKKLQDNVLTATEHAKAVQAFIAFMAAVQPPPSGDKNLIKRAEEIRGGRTCRQSADGIYLALAEELGNSVLTEVVTFDNGIQTQATQNGLAPRVELLLPTI